MGTIDEEERQQKIRRDVAKEGIQIENEYYMLLDDEIKKINDERNKSKELLKKVIETKLDNHQTEYGMAQPNECILHIWLNREDGWMDGQKVRVTIKAIESKLQHKKE